MANGKSPSVSAEMNIPTYLPLPKAARKYGLSEKVLTQLVKAGKIEAVQLPSGEVLVPANNGSKSPQTKDEIIAEKFAHLRDKPISAHAAQESYGVHHTNFIRWARAGYINILSEQKRLIELDEAEVAYCAHIYHQKRDEYGGRIAGVKLFDQNGNPYQVKYPDLSARRREQ